MLAGVGGLPGFWVLLCLCTHAYTEPSLIWVYTQIPPFGHNGVLAIWLKVLRGSAQFCQGNLSWFTLKPSRPLPCYLGTFCVHKHLPFWGLLEGVLNPGYPWIWAARCARLSPGPRGITSGRPIKPRLIYGRTALKRPCSVVPGRGPETGPSEGCSTVDQARIDHC